MRFVYAYGEGFIVVSVSPKNDGSAMVVVASNIEREQRENRVVEEESIELRVRVDGATQMSLPQIEAAAFRRAAAILEAAKQVMGEQMQRSLPPDQVCP